MMKLTPHLKKYSSLKNTEILHEYLTELGDDWPALIPIEFTNEGEHYTETHAKQIKRKRSNDTKLAHKAIPTHTSKRLRKD